MSVSGERGRDARIDFTRGLAVLLVCTDHIAAGRMRYFTPYGRCFFDLTEVFVFLSGCACGLAYTRRLDRSGFAACQREAIRRGLRIYSAYVAASLLLWSAGWVWPPLHGPAAAFPDRAAVADLLVLREGPVELTVLPLYMLIALLTPFVVWCRSRWPNRTLLVSGILYAVAQSDLSMWFMALDPLAWQFLFVLGVACTSPEERRLRLPSGPIAVLAAIFALQASISVLLVASKDEVPLIDKGRLEPLRLVTFAAAVIVGRALLPRREERSKATWSAFLRVAGRHSLLVFCCGAFLSRIADIALQWISGGLIVDFVMACCVWIGLIIIAALAESIRQHLRRSRDGIYLHHPCTT